LSWYFLRTITTTLILRKVQSIFSFVFTHAALVYVLKKATRKSKKMRWVVHVALVGEKKSVYNILVENHRGKGLLVVNERVIIKCTVNEYCENIWTGYM
jgi:hypothetical protein